MPKCLNILSRRPHKAFPSRAERFKSRDYVLRFGERNVSLRDDSIERLLWYVDLCEIVVAGTGCVVVAESNLCGASPGVCYDRKNRKEISCFVGTVFDGVFQTGEGTGRFNVNCIRDPCLKTKVSITGRVLQL